MADLVDVDWVVVAHVKSEGVIAVVSLSNGIRIFVVWAMLFISKLDTYCVEPW